MTVIELFNDEEIHDIEETAAEWGTDVQTLVHDAVLSEIAHSAHWENQRAG